MNKNYETVIIFTPVLNDEEVKKQIQKYVGMIKDAGGSIVHEDHWGLRQLAYPIQKKTTGIYHIIEYDVPGEFIDNFELQFRRDENVIRFLTTALDKYALDYNDRKRNGLIGKKREPKVAEPVVPNLTSTAAVAEPATETIVAPPVTEIEKVVVEEVAAVEEVTAVVEEPKVEAEPPPTEEPKVEAELPAEEPASETVVETEVKETTTEITDTESEKTDEK